LETKNTYNDIGVLITKETTKYSHSIAEYGHLNMSNNIEYSRLSMPIITECVDRNN